MTTNVAIADGLDPLVQYTGTWANDGFGTPEQFQRTARWSSVQGSTASLSFVGSSVTVFGTVGEPPIVAGQTRPQVSFTFVVDNSITGTYTPPADLTGVIYHEPFWASPPLGDGPHTLVITQSEAATIGIILLDYIMWTTTSLAVPAYFIDDRDPRVVYTPPWRQLGSDSNFLHTSQGSTNIGDSLSLQFEGTAISHYAEMTAVSAPNILNASFSLDGGPPVFYVPVPQPSAQMYNVPYYSSGVLSPGNHTLVVTAVGAEAIWTDYWLVTPNPASFTTTSASASGTSSSPSSTSPTMSPTTTSTVTPKKKHTAAIAGSVVGVVVILFLMLGAVFLCRRHRRKIQRQLPMAQALDVAALEVTPYPGPVTNGAATPTHLAGSGSPLLDALAEDTWRDRGTSGEWAGPSGAAPPAHYAGRNNALPEGIVGGSPSAGPSSSNPMSPPLAASASGVLPSGKRTRYEAPPTRAAASQDGDAEMSEEPPGYESAWGHSSRA
ncbi:hypothetical protein FB451DRAFT_157331 [Mycena latifolia]|nr:hypothetical protein FB451DRAFT_157331 [Mycena latifolia]